MSVISKSADRPSPDATDANNINSVETVADKLYSLLAAGDSESIAEEFDIGIHNETHDFDNHLKVAIREHSLSL